MADLYMDFDAVKNMAKRFDQVGSTLKFVSNALEVCMTILKTTALVGLVGGYALERYISILKPQIDELSEKCVEMGNDLQASAVAFENGEMAGSTRFY